MRIYLIIMIFSLILNFGSNVQAKEKKEFILKGKVLNSVTKKPVDFGAVLIPELKLKTASQEDGSYLLKIAGPGEYTVIARSSGLQIIKIKMLVNKDMVKNFYLAPMSIKSSGIIIYGERDIQKISRYTMTASDLKSVPASFGDSLNALTILPGVIRAGGFFGPLVIRGSSPITHNYFIDDFPVFSPMHYGGLHSVINNNLISAIDLYASAFPASYGSATSSVININTMDDVKEFGGWTDVSLLSLSSLIMLPIYKRDSSVHLAGPNYKYDKTKDEKKGYLIFSGRYGYFTLALELTKLLVNNIPDILPEYWDYQVKTKYYLNKYNSLTLLLFGSSDYLRANISQKSKDEVDQNGDPLVMEINLLTDQMFHTQGLTYTYQPDRSFRNTLQLYSTLNKVSQYVNFKGLRWFPSSLDGIYINSKPNIYGVKNKTRIEWWKDHSEFRFGLEYTLYRFVTKGKSFYVTRGLITQGKSGEENSAAFYTYTFDKNFKNDLYSAYAENKFTFGGLTLLPGFRSDYLVRTKFYTQDPRGMVSYELPAKTTISAAGGQYSYFFQVNPRNFNSNPDLAELGVILKPEKGIHRVVGIEQRIDLFTIKLEAFINNYLNMPEAYPHTEPDGSFLQGLSSGQMKTRGVEVMLQKDRLENENGIFGWLCYTYTRSSIKTGLPTEKGLYGIPSNTIGDPYGDQWIDSNLEQRHSIKLTTGYVLGGYSLSSRFQMNTSFPYTPIISSQPDTAYTLLTGRPRFVPDYGIKNSRHFPVYHTLDVRFSKRTHHSWGYVEWYIEVINIYNKQQIDREYFDKSKPFGPNNPNLEPPPDQAQISMFPSFGVEVKF